MYTNIIGRSIFRTQAGPVQVALVLEAEVPVAVNTGTAVSKGCCEMEEILGVGIKFGIGIKIILRIGCIRAIIRITQIVRCG